MQDNKIATIEELEQVRDDLTQQLYRAERALSLGTLTTGVAHHFNNLLSVILGYSSLILNREHLSSDARNALRRISEAAQRGRNLTNDLLAFAGGEGEDPEICNVHKTLKNTISLLESHTPSTIHIQTKLRAGNDKILASPSELHQVVFNLLTNAIDSMPEGGQLIVTTRNSQNEKAGKAGEYLSITVTDSGGVLPEDLEAEADEVLADESKAGNMEFKLSRIYGIVRSMAGTVLTQSTPGEETCVEVLIPTVTDVVGTNYVQVDNKLNSCTIWVVDDDPIFREMCQVVLSEQGHEIEEIADGIVFKDRWLEEPNKADLVILDFSMPECNGHELREWLEAHKCDIPVILVSGLSASYPDITKALELKRTYFLQKPFSFLELADSVSLALGESLIN